jgi:CheY-like chemotaxis protein
MIARTVSINVSPLPDETPAVNSPPAAAPVGLLISRDLLFTSKVTGTARDLNLPVKTVLDAAAALTLVAEGEIRAIFVDLAESRLDLPGLMSGLPADRPPAVIAFGSHVATALLQAARDAGCTEVLPRSRFSAELPDLLQRYLAPPD